jgi:RND family efflux transporter MFP subunit
MTDEPRDERTAEPHADPYLQPGPADRPAAHAAEPTGDAPPRRAPSKKRVALVALGVLLLGALVAFLAVKLKPEPERRAPDTPPPLVQVVTVTTRAVALNVHSQGTVEPRTESTLVAQVDGRIVDVAEAWAAGGFFRAGEVLVEIDPRDYRLAVADAEAAVADARVALEREQAEAELAREEWEELGDGGEPSALLLRKPQLAQARARLEAAQAAVERARLDLERTRVTAPFDGRVRGKQADLGQYVAPGTPLAEVYATEYAEVRLPVSKEDLQYLAVGVGWSADGRGPEGGTAPPVQLFGELAGATRTWQAKVVRTGAEIDPRSRMLAVFARVDDPYHRDGRPASPAPPSTPPPLPMGLFVEAEIAGRIAPAAVVLPRRVLRTTARTRDAEVLVVDAADTLRFRRVEVLRTVGDDVVIGSGLADGDRVVVSRLEEAVPGMRVRTTPAPPEPETGERPAEAGPEDGGPAGDGRL